MSAIFPTDNKPYIFSGTLDAGSEDTSRANLDRHPGAFVGADFTSAVPAGAMQLFLTFVLFAYPTPRNTAETSLAPILELLGPAASFDAPGTALRQTPDGPASLALAGGKFVNYSFKPLGHGVFRVVLTPGNIALDAVSWLIRFTINDGATGPSTQLGLTFTVADQDSRSGWIAVPGQADLTPSGPPPIDFGGAVASITLAGAAPSDPAHLLPGDRPIFLSIPVGNYGTAPLAVSAPAAAAIGRFEMSLAHAFTLAPGSSDIGTVTMIYRPPATGEIQSPASATTFSLTSDDPLAAASGASAHFNTLSFYASSAPIPAPVLAPSPNQFSPRQGAHHCRVRVTGEHLDISPIEVRLGDTPMILPNPGPGWVDFSVPPRMPVGPARITVTTRGGSVTSDDVFTIWPSPAFAAPGEQLDTQDGSPGNSLSLFGRDFIIPGAETVRVTFDQSTPVELPVLGVPTAARIDVIVPDLGGEAIGLFIIVWRSDGDNVQSDDPFNIRLV